MDNIPRCPGLCSYQVCQVGKCPCPPQTLEFPFGSSLEPSLKGGPCCQCSPSDIFFLTFFRVYRNVLQRIRSALSCVSFRFLPLLKNQFHEERQMMEYMCCTQGQLHAHVRAPHVCAHACVDMETGYIAPYFSPCSGFPIHAVRDLI